MKLLLALPAILLCFGAIACGSDSTSPNNGGSQAPQPVPEETQQPSGPEGTLTPTSFGSVEQGMEINEVTSLWGEPDKRNRFPGCEVNPEATPIIVLTWNVQDGDVIAQFTASTKRLDSYQTSSRRFPTKRGVRIGNSFSVVKGTDGTMLQPLNLGVDSTPVNGYWFTGDLSRAAQLYAVAGGKITTISGGHLPPCE